jgi:hypothetical protein
MASTRVRSTISQKPQTSKTSTVRLIPLTILNVISYPSDRMSCSAIVAFWVPINEASPTPAKPLIRTLQGFTFYFSQDFEGWPYMIGLQHLGSDSYCSAIPKGLRGRLVFLCASEATAARVSSARKFLLSNGAYSWEHIVGSKTLEQWVSPCSWDFLCYRRERTKLIPAR